MSTRRPSLLETVVRRTPGFLRDAAIDLANPLRVRAMRPGDRPRWLTLFVTNHCNARCGHCFYWQSLNSRLPELSPDQYARLFGGLQVPLVTARLSGGEPFLRRDLGEIVVAADRSWRVGKVAVPTHGGFRNLPDRVSAMLDRLERTHLTVSVSLEGTAALHDANRKIPGGFDLAIANLRRLRALEAAAGGRFDVSVSVSLSAANTAMIQDSEGTADCDLLRLLRFLRDDVGIENIGFDHIRGSDTDVFDLPAAMASGVGPPDVGEASQHAVSDTGHGTIEENAAETAAGMTAAPDRAAVDALIDPWLGEGRAGRLTRLRMAVQREILARRGRVVDCVAGTADAVVYPSGAVAVCEFTRPFADLHDYDFNLPALLRDRAADDARRATRSCACTHPCHLSDSLAYDAGFLKRFLADGPV